MAVRETEFTLRAHIGHEVLVAELLMTEDVGLFCETCGHLVVLEDEKGNLE